MNCRVNAHSWGYQQETKDQPDTHSDNFRTRSTTDSGTSGLIARSTCGSQHICMFSDKEISDDILATMPKLHAAVRNNATGERWKHRSGKGGVRLAELKLNSSPAGPDFDPDILHATAAKTELKCHLNEALSVLLHQDSEGYDSTMKTLCGKQFKKGEVLFEQQIIMDAKSQRNDRALLATGSDDEALSQGLITVTSAAMMSCSGLKQRLQSRHNRAQRLIFSTFTYQFPSKKRAVHLMKTVPKDIHGQVSPIADNSPLRGKIDHIGVGFELHFTPATGGTNHQRTTVFAHAYASDRAPLSVAEDPSDCPEVETKIDAIDLARRRVTVLNPEAQNTMRILTDSLSHFERVIRRRRFGFQSFIYFPNDYADALLEKRCLICNKNFHFFRRDFYCQLCGHMVCGDCSELHEVEAQVGRIRKNRCCRLCVVRVDACKFDNEDLLAALGPIIVETPSDAWSPSEGSILSSPRGEDVDSTDDNNFMGQLCSEDPGARSQALQQLRKLVTESTGTSTSLSTPAQITNSKDRKARQKESKTTAKTQAERVLASIENHINEELSKPRPKSVEACDVSDRTRDYKYRFDPTKVSHEDIPLAPMPEAEKEMRRIKFAKTSGALQPEYDRSALNLIAEVAAKRLGCSIGVVSMIDDQQFHAIGNYNLPAEAHHLPMNEVLCMHTVYAEKPLVVKNPQRDMRFSKMPCVDGHGVKFYAEFPLRSPNGDVFGNLCALDGVAHNNISTKDYSTMETLVKLASDLLAPTTAKES
ncbi:unnamed protein product [Phytophthora fragariaefolia]|uniref:Unnamed protein product n=1 Tax=Phytophthora fragariaefolia TaxID=1490495 RepID=A0A9W6TXQ0_9STRA|nr:unnamed protein product [Phytophthora fragariaefolia]